MRPLVAVFRRQTSFGGRQWVWQVAHRGGITAGYTRTPVGAVTGLAAHLVRLAWREVTR